MDLSRRWLLQALDCAASETSLVHLCNRSETLALPVEEGTIGTCFRGRKESSSYPEEEM